MHLSLSESDRCYCSMNFDFADFIVYIGLLCTTKSAKKKCTSSLWIRWSSSYGSSRTCCGWPLNFFFVIYKCKNDITRFVSITRVNAIIFILLITVALASTVVVFITIFVITVWQRFIFSFVSVSLNLVCSKSVPSGFIWRSQCLVRCFSSVWCLRYLFSSGTRSFFSFVRSSKNLSKHNPHNVFSVAFWLPLSLSSALFFLKPTTSRCVRYKQKNFA